MRRSRTVSIALAALVGASGMPAAPAQERPTVAVLPMSFLHLPLLDAHAETERLRQAFAASGRFEVLSDVETRARLQKAGVRDERCHEVECAVEFGAALRVQKVFTAQVLQLGRRSLIRARHVDVPSAKAELAESVEFVGEVAEVPRVLLAIVGRVLSPPPPAPTAVRPVVLSFDGPKEPFYTRPWFLITVGALVAAGTATGLVLGLRSGGPNTGSATFGF
jgi:hypothetical protein